MTRDYYETLQRNADEIGKWDRATSEQHRYGQPNRDIKQAVELLPPKKPWGEILQRNGEYHVVTNDTRGKRKHHYTTKFHAIARDWLNLELAIHWTNYRWELKEYESAQRKAEQGPAGNAVRGQRDRQDDDGCQLPEAVDSQS